MRYSDADERDCRRRADGDVPRRAGLPAQPAGPGGVVDGAAWFGALLAFYGPYLSVALFFLMLGRDLLSTEPLWPAWLSVRLLAWLGAVGAGAAAVLTWANLAAFSTVLSDAARERMRDGALPRPRTAVALVARRGAAVFVRPPGQPAGRPRLLVTCLVAVGGGAALAARARRGARLPRRPRATRIRPRLPSATRVAFAPRVSIFALDGASLGFIRQRVAAGQLPNFGRLLDRGATIDLATLKPTQAEPVWAAAATGKSPQQNGIRSERELPRDEDDVVAADILPDYCFASALLDQGFVQPIGADLVVALRPAGLGHPRRLRHRVGDCRLAADVSGTRRSRVRAERPLRRSGERAASAARRERRRSDDGRGHRARDLRPLAGDVARRGHARAGLRTSRSRSA